MEKNATVNLVEIHEWKPGKDYKKGNFPYDSIGEEVKPQINIDTDDDGRPDINLDFDGDGVPDINIDTDGDNIPDINIDSTGDGKPDVNVDTDDDGEADENIVKITEWKPEHNADKPFPYDTMKFEEKTKLEDNGIIVEKPDGTTFSPSLTLKVTDITKDKVEAVTDKISNNLDEGQEVIQVFDVKLLENGKEIQPDGTLRVKIPVKSGIKNPSLYILNEAGEYEKVEAEFKDGYLIYETDWLGEVAVIGNEDELDTDVNGAFYPGANMGGALTGDTTNTMMYIGLGCMSIGIMLLVLYKREQED